MALVDLQQAVRKDLAFNAGDSVRLELQFKQGGVAIDMSGYTSSVAEIEDAISGQILEAFAIDYTDAATGTIVLTLTASQTDALCPCNAIWFFQAILAADPDNNTHTVIGGKVEVVKRRGLGG